LPSNRFLGFRLTDTLTLPMMPGIGLGCDFAETFRERLKLTFADPAKIVKKPGVRAERLDLKKQLLQRTDLALRSIGEDHAADTSKTGSEGLCPQV
jgi:hypothetical protein